MSTKNWSMLNPDEQGVGLLRMAFEDFNRGAKHQIEENFRFIRYAYGKRFIIQ